MSELQTPEQGTEQTEPVTQPENTEETVALEPTADEVEATSTEEPNTEDTTPAPQPEVVPKEKFVASQRESILNHERIEVANSRLEQLTKTDTPTDEAMRQLYPEWDQLDDYNKRVLIRQETTAMQQARILASQQEIDARLKLDEQLETVIDTNPKLKGKEMEFKRFAKRKENLGISAEILAKAFLFDGSDDEPTPMPTPRTDALPTGSGGPREPIKPHKISLADAAILQKTDYREYKKQLLAGNIEDEV